MGRYTENLRSGGQLIVYGNNWDIQYYFPGPDRRYNGSFYTIKGRDVDRYITAWKNNFDKYLELKESFELHGSYSVAGECRMRISIGGWSDGVSLDGYHMTIKNEEQLNRLIDDYKSAKLRAEKIQALLSPSSIKNQPLKVKVKVKR